MVNKKRISGVGFIGAIINILFGMGIIFVVIPMFIQNSHHIHPRFHDQDIYLLIFISYFALMSIFSIVKNIEVMGNYNKKLSAILFSFFSVSFIGSFLLMVSRNIVKVERIKVKVKEIEQELDFKELVAELTKFKLLLDSNVITEDEYIKIKSKLINHIKQ